MKDSNDRREAARKSELLRLEKEYRVGEERINELRARREAIKALASEDSLRAADDPSATDTQRLEEAEAQAFRLLLKFHNETHCGHEGMHWAECDALVHAFGWRSWESWYRIATGGLVWSPSQVRLR